ncbi:MAG: VOC family protein [Phycisphaerales bacterium]
MPRHRSALISTRPLAWMGVLALAVSGIAAAEALRPAAHEPTPPRQITRSEAHITPISAITGVAITVSDLDDSIRWYTSVLDAELVSESTLEGDDFSRLTGMFAASARAATLRIGNERLDLIEFLTPRGRAFPADSRGNDRWFQHVAIIVRDMDEAYARLAERGVTHASPAPQRLPDWNPKAGGIRAFYFRDPDGHYLEILEFPRGKGQDRWQSDDRLFLGIDHTAIVVDDTEASLRYYRDHLGMSVVGGSENYGPEQERLNAVFPARLRITTLRAPSGPAIELLEYLTPRDGRPMPADSRPADLWHWHILAETGDPGAMFDACRAAGGAPISPGAQAGGALAHAPSDPALLARDPDGHALLFLATPDARRP